MFFGVLWRNVGIARCLCGLLGSGLLPLLLRNPLVENWNVLFLGIEKRVRPSGSWEEMGVGSKKNKEDRKGL